MESITLASGQTLHKGQYIQLTNKISDLFPRLKGNVLPTRTYDFFQSEQATHFEYVEVFSSSFSSKFYLLEKQIQELENIENEPLSHPMENEEGCFQAINIMGLVVDQIQYFALENNVVYVYTQVFKIDIAKALTYQEVMLPANGQHYSEKDIEDIQKVIEKVHDALGHRRIGTRSLEDTNRRIFLLFRTYFSRRNKWCIKDLQVQETRHYNDEFRVGLDF